MPLRAEQAQVIKVDDIVQRLAWAGLDEDGSRAYLHLAIHGTAPAGRVARELDWSRTNTYRILGRLADQGFVLPTSDRPTRFSAAPVSGVFDHLLAVERARLDDLERLRDETLASITRLQEKAGAPSAESLMRVVRGRRDIRLIGEVMARQAKRSVSIVTTSDTGGDAGQRLRAWRDLLQRTRDGVDIRVIVGGSDAVAAIGGTAIDGDVRVPADGPPMTMMIVDDREVLQWVVRDGTDRTDGAGDAAMWSNGEEFGRSQAEFFATLWAQVDPDGAG